MVEGKKDAIILDTTTIIIRVPEGKNGYLKAVDRIITDFKRALEEHEIPFEVCVSGGKSFEVKK